MTRGIVLPKKVPSRRCVRRYDTQGGTQPGCRVIVRGEFPVPKLFFYFILSLVKRVYRRNFKS